MKPIERLPGLAITLVNQIDGIAVLWLGLAAFRGGGFHCISFPTMLVWLLEETVTVAWLCEA